MNYYNKLDRNYSTTTNKIYLYLDTRHWKELMEKTGTKFEINTESFTLENMFAMELHKHSVVIDEIVTCAVKELGIEKASCFIAYILCLSYSRPVIMSN